MIGHVQLAVQASPARSQAKAIHHVMASVQKKWSLPKHTNVLQLTRHLISIANRRKPFVTKKRLFY